MAAKIKNIPAFVLNVGDLVLSIATARMKAVAKPNGIRHPRSRIPEPTQENNFFK